MKKSLLLAIIILLIVFLIAACGPSQEELDAMMEGTMTSVALSWTPTFTNTPVPSNTPLPTATPTETVVPTPVWDDICVPGNTIEEDSGEVGLGHIDLLKVETKLDGEELTAILYLRDIPDEFIINRDHVEKGHQEYTWSVSINTDNDETTGSRDGSDYSLQLFSFKMNAKKTGPLEVVMANDAAVWKRDGNSATKLSSASFTVDYDENTITLVGRIPNITEDSRLSFYTFELHPDDGRVQDTVCQIVISQ